MSVTVATTIANIRSEADIEEPEASSIVTDAQLLVWLNKGYRRLVDILADEVGLEYFGTTASVGPSSWSVPADFYRPIGIDILGSDGTLQSAKPWNFAERNYNDLWTGITPKFRVIKGVIVWRPAASAPTAAVTLWYVPLPADLASNGSFDAFNGWDDFVIKYVVLEVKRKQEYPLADAERALAKAESVVRHNAGRLRGYPLQVSDAEGRQPYWFYNG